MGKKGKKKAKITGTPEVVAFKQTREFWLLQECMNIQETLPFVAVDNLTEENYKRVARFLNMVGLLAEHCNIKTNKDYRFNFHHKYLAPIPQFLPFGYDVNVIRQARLVQEKPGISYNGDQFPFPEDLRTSSEKFLKEVDGYMTTLASDIEPQVKNDFANGLRSFKNVLKEALDYFDKLWIKYESEYVKAFHEIMSKVFEPIDRLVTIELSLTQAEERYDMDGEKQRLENELVQAVEDFAHTLFPELRAESFPEDVIPLAEACIFYESKCTDEWLHLAKHLIKDYMELRTFIMKIPEERLKPELKENSKLVHLINSFHASVLAAREALEFVRKKPALVHAKTSNWMTKSLLDGDLKYIHKTAHLHARENN